MVVWCSSVVVVWCGVVAWWCGVVWCSSGGVVVWCSSVVVVWGCGVVWSQLGDDFVADCIVDLHLWVLSAKYMSSLVERVKRFMS